VGSDLVVGRARARCRPNSVTIGVGPAGGRDSKRENNSQYLPPKWIHEQWRRGQRNRDAAYESWQAPTIQNPHIPTALSEAERARLDPDTFAEKYEAKFLGPPEPCELCGWPDPNWNGAIIILGDDEEPERCTACGHSIDKRGKTLLGADEEGNPRSLFMRCDPAGLTDQEIRNLQDWNGSRVLG
jgi:hypothetical protein